MTLPPYYIFPKLSCDRILLREIKEHDISQLFSISFYDAVAATNLVQAQAMQEKINEDYNQGNSIHWGVTERATNSIVGTCGYYRGFEHGAGELGCVLLPQFRKQGLMLPAMQLAIDFGLNRMGLSRIWASTATENYPAKKLLYKLGFVETRQLPDDEIEYELSGR